MRRVRGDGMVYRKAFQLFSDLISHFNNALVPYIQKIRLGRNYDWAAVQLLKSEYWQCSRALMFWIEINAVNPSIYVLKMHFNKIEYTN